MYRLGFNCTITIKVTIELLEEHSILYKCLIFSRYVPQDYNMEYLLTIPCTREPEESFAAVFEDKVAVYTEKWMKERDVKIEENRDFITTTVKTEIGMDDIPIVVKTEVCAGSDAVDCQQQQRQQ